MHDPTKPPPLDLAPEAMAAGPLNESIVFGASLAPAMRPGWQTTELWLIVIANALANLGAIDVGGAKYRGLLAILSTVAYAISRGLAKAGPNA